MKKNLKYVMTFIFLAILPMGLVHSNGGEHVNGDPNAPCTSPDDAGRNSATAKANIPAEGAVRDTPVAPAGVQTAQ